MENKSKFVNTLWKSDKQSWGSPQWLFHKLHSFYNFKTDPCTSEDNPLGCKTFFTERTNGLNWRKWDNGNVYINPPYNDAYKWVQEAYHFFCNRDWAVVILLPARVGNKLWQNLVFPKANLICFIRGRLRFDGTENSAPFDSALIVFSSKILYEEENLYKDIGTVVKVR